MSKLIFTFWGGTKPGIYEQLSFASFDLLNSNFVLYTYENLELDSEFQIRDASDVVPKDVYEGWQGNLAEFADHFRFSALRKLPAGSMWADADCICVSESFEPKEYEFSWQGPANNSLINTAIVSLPPNHPLISELILEIPRLIGKQWGSTGPVLFTEKLQKYGVASEAQSHTRHYAIRQDQIDLLFDPLKLNKAQQAINNSVTFHFWNEMLNIYGIDKRFLPPKGSLMGLCFERYLPNVTGPRFGSKWLWKFRGVMLARKLLRFLRKLFPNFFSGKKLSTNLNNLQRKVMNKDFL